MCIRLSIKKNVIYCTLQEKQIALSKIVDYILYITFKMIEILYRNEIFGMFSYTSSVHNFITYFQIEIWHIFNYYHIKIFHLASKNSSLTLKESKDRYISYNYRIGMLFFILPWL